MSDRYDALVVPGARVYDDGSLSPAFVRRLSRAVEIWQEGRGAVLIISGRGPGPVSEGEAGAAWVIARGVPEQAVHIEVRAGSTRDNARYTAAMVSGRVLVVTCDTHAFRCRRVFADSFAEVEVEAVPSPGRWKTRVREWGSLLKDYWRYGL